MHTNDSVFRSFGMQLYFGIPAVHHDGKTQLHHKELKLLKAHVLHRNLQSLPIHLLFLHGFQYLPDSEINPLILFLQFQSYLL